MGDSRSGLTTRPAARRRYLFVLCLIRVAVRVGSGRVREGTGGRAKERRRQTVRGGRAGDRDKGTRGHPDRRRAHLGSPACSCTSVRCSWWPPAGDVWRRARGRGAATSGGGRGRLRGDPPLSAATTRPARAPASQSAPAAPTRDPERPVGAGPEASRCGTPAGPWFSGLQEEQQGYSHGLVRNAPSSSCHLAWAWTLLFLDCPGTHSVPGPLTFYHCGHSVKACPKIVLHAADT